MDRDGKLRKNYVFAAPLGTLNACMVPVSMLLEISFAAVWKGQMANSSDASNTFVLPESVVVDQDMSKVYVAGIQKPVLFSSFNL